MVLWHAFVIALVQGVTEFLPISSSAHEIFISQILGWEDQGVAFDAFTGLGTLVAAIVYFWHDIRTIITHWLRQFHPSKSNTCSASRLGNQLILATLPALLIGFIFRHQINDYLRNPLIIATTSIIFGLLLGYADIVGKKFRQIGMTNTRQALIYGLAQTLALIPGTSRSGITITAGLLMGFTQQSAARFSFLLSIPISAATGLYGFYKLASAPRNDFSLAVIAVAFLTAFISGWLCIALFLRFINTIGMWPHVIYRLIFGIVLLMIIF